MGEGGGKCLTPAPKSRRALIWTQGKPLGLKRPPPNFELPLRKPHSYLWTSNLRNIGGGGYSTAILEKSHFFPVDWSWAAWGRKAVKFHVLRYLLRTTANLLCTGQYILHTAQMFEYIWMQQKLVHCWSKDGCLRRLCKELQPISATILSTISWE